MADEIFILTTGPIEGLGGMERFLQYVSSGFQERGYGVRVFHSENTGPERRRHSKPTSKLGLLLDAGLRGYYIGTAAERSAPSRSPAGAFQFHRWLVPIR